MDHSAPGVYLTSQQCVRVPLATLQNELNSYLATLKTKLVEVINEDYSDYVGLSGRLANVEGAVVRMRRPLIELRDKLHAVQEAVRSELNSLNQGLRRRKEVATQRALLELTLEVSHVAAKVEKLLEEVAASDSVAVAAAAGGEAAADGAPAPPSPRSPLTSASAAAASAASASASAAALSDAELLAHCRLLERVAAEVSRLAFLANKGKDLAFVRALEPRIAGHRAALRGRLKAALAAALAPAPAPQPAGAAPGGGPRSVAAALHALHAAADLCEPGEAEGVVRSVVVAPMVERLIAEHKSATGHSASLGGLSALLSAITAGVRSSMGSLLEAALAPGSALRGLDLLGAAVLEEVQGALAAAMPGVFSPGVPPAFHANYRATLAWLAGLEELCATRGSVERLRSCPAHASLMRRWNTSVYFSLLYQEIAGELEDALSADRLEAPPPLAPGGAADPLTAAAAPQLAPTATLLRCLRRATSPEVVLPPLTDRFLRLALQLAQRYAAWLATAATARREAVAAAAAGGGGAGALGVVPGAAAAAGAAGSPAPTGAAAWATSMSAEELLVVVADAESVHSVLLGPFTTAFLELLPQSTPTAAPPSDCAAPDAAGDAAPNVIATVRSALAEAAEAVRGGGRSLAAALTDEAIERCVTVVRQLKGITATYRMTSKGPPSRASHYVGGVLTPLRSLLEAGSARRLASQFQRELLVLPVADGVCSRYGALAEELLSSVRKTESSLKRLKKAKGGAGGEEDSAASAISDSDKITLQLHLDVEELGRQLAALLVAGPAASADVGEVVAAALPTFRRLQEVVAPPPGLLAALAAGGGGTSAASTGGAASGGGGLL
ncbi:hypothetical protein GPECTOR_8g343 [Gonium pectorale]|uniref:Conserved oligomeric Golgi complex subunit 2 n=1 Tax=Gonium pectorale TaxID=33097 RepID=A0A150GT30_GONPE|nr:hypothetical protein GPECTOR_8g343 [Gonium pectorale]|eukprot:KXZ52971.1 hypothetical protein GPECTOR_8g343 [Gonium pectorale]